MTTNKTYEKWKKVLKKKTMTENEIIYFRKAVGNSSKLPQELKHSLLEEFVNNNKTYSITKEQSKRGIEWLNRHCFKLNGDTRKGCKLGLNERHIVRNFKKFEFVGLKAQNEIRGFYDNYYSPIYRTFDKQGNYFDYTVWGPWGSIQVV